MPLLLFARPPTVGGLFSDKAKAGLAEYQAFRRQHRGLGREELSELWRERKLSMGRPEARRQAFSSLSDEEVASMLERAGAEREQDPKYLFNELLRRSQSNPVCFPYGLSPPELRDVAKLQQALYRVRGGVYGRGYRRQ